MFEQGSRQKGNVCYIYAIYIYIFWLELQCVAIDELNVVELIKGENGNFSRQPAVEEHVQSEAALKAPN